MGLFSSKPKTPVLNLQVPTLPTAQDIFSQSLAFNKGVSPLALGARESALSDLARGNDYYAGFQPTSFEQALASQNFQNIMPDVERSIKHNLSLSGIANSPILAQQIAQQRGNLGVSIGQYLSELGNQRANDSLNARFGIDPNQILQPFADTQVSQSQAQAQMLMQKYLLEAQNQQQRALEQAQQKAGMISSIGTLLGGGAGFLMGGPVGAGFGASLGGAGASLFGGGQAPVSMADALSIAQFASPKTNTGFMNPGSFQGQLMGYGKGAPESVFNTGNQSIFRFPRTPGYAGYGGLY